MMCEENIVDDCVRYLAQDGVKFEPVKRTDRETGSGFEDTILYHDEEQEEYAGSVTILPYDELEEFKINQEDK